jgi:hypothetical protein
MSRGFGRVQRTILDVLGRAIEPIDAPSLAVYVYPSVPRDESGTFLITVSQCESVGRALRRLRHAGKVTRLSNGCFVLRRDTERLTAEDA